MTWALGGPLALAAALGACTTPPTADAGPDAGPGTDASPDTTPDVPAEARPDATDAGHQVVDYDHCRGDDCGPDAACTPIVADDPPACRRRCIEATECPLPPGTTATPVCAPDRRCALSCYPQRTVCPYQLRCLSVGTDPSVGWCR